MYLPSSFSSSQTLTPGLNLFDSIINKERSILNGYAAKPTSNPKYVDVRNNFLQRLTDSYNLLYSELTVSARLQFYDKWQLADQQARLLLKDSDLAGIYMRLTLKEGDNYGFIQL